jgi:RHS repeat-associated protein
VLTTNVGVTTTYFVGAHYEVSNGIITKYYYAGSTRIAMRKNGTLTYLFGDHLGSTSLVTDANGVVISEVKYKAWGETRYSSGTNPTDYTYTGQYSYTDDFGLMFYNARFYDPQLGRFSSPDSIIPPTQGVQAWDRYAYTNNNPVRYTDPTGHYTCVNNSKTYNGDCHKVIDKWLEMLETQGGEEGKDLVESFRAADSNTYCNRAGCFTENDIITIYITDDLDGAAMQYGTSGSDTFSVSSEIITSEPSDQNINDLANAGAFGHEIFHMDHDPLKTLNPLDFSASGTKRGEVDAYTTQQKIYQNMGIDTYTENGFIYYANEFSSLSEATREELQDSPLVTSLYGDMPLDPLDKISRNWNLIWSGLFP